MEELNILRSDQIIVEIDKTEISEPYAKVLLLFEAYLRKKPLQTFSLISDTAYIV